MGLLRVLRRRDRCYSLLAGFFLVYISWSFLSSQERIDSLRRGPSPGQALGLPDDKRELSKRMNLLPYGYSGNEDALELLLPKNPIATKIQSDMLTSSQKRPHLSHLSIESNPRNRVVPNNSDINSERYDADEESKLSLTVLPSSRDSAFNERMKSHPYAPEAGNTLPNYFLHADSTNGTRARYGGTVVTYLHHNKAAGSSVKDCLAKVSKAQRKRIALMDSNGRVATVTRLKQRANSFQFYMGGYSFGVCEQLSPQPCSYFTFVRDPYERVISSYSYCRRAATDQLCQPGDPWAMTMKEWVLFQGSFLFRQILFRPQFCKLPKPKVTVKTRNARVVPCWYKEKMHLIETLSDTTREDLLDYVISNLDKWFAVIGVTEEYDTSLAMLEEAYGIPFHSKCSGKKINVSDYRNVDDKGTSANETEHALFVKRTKAELMADEEVRWALRADIRIYEQAKFIFERQREKYKVIHGLT